MAGPLTDAPDVAAPEQTLPADGNSPSVGAPDFAAASGVERAGSGPLDLVFRLPGADTLAERLGRAEVRRRLLHMVPGLLPFVLWIYPHDYPWSADDLPVRVWVAGLAVLLAFFGLAHFSSVARQGERGGIDSVLGYSFSVLGSLAIAPLHPEYTLIVLSTLAFGDGSATLGGILIGGPKLFWNRKKTWAGLLCFWVSATLLAALVYWGEVVPTPTWAQAFTVGALVSIGAAIAESLPLRMNDNLRVGVATLVGCFLVVEQEMKPLKMLCVGAVVIGLIAWRRSRAPDSAPQ